MHLIDDEVDTRDAAGNNCLKEVIVKVIVAFVYLLMIMLQKRV